MHKLILSELPIDIIQNLQPSFNNLPNTDHADGKFRLRRYSMVNYFGNDIGKSSFTQSSEYNTYQGDVIRKFEPIEQETLNSSGFKAIHKTFMQICSLSAEHIEVHQMRVIVPEGEEVAQLSPEGPHRDGFDYVGIFSINRKNILGGELIAYCDKEPDSPFLTYTLKPGEAVIINDRELLHDGAPVKRQNVDVKDNYMDVFVLTATRGM